MDLNATRMFVTVVKAGSLSAAASRLGIPLPTLSRRIRELERALKVQLLERSVRGTHLTEAGDRFYQHASQGIDVLAEAEQALLDSQTHLNGRLRISLPPSFEPWWQLTAAFRRSYPDIQLHVQNTERRIDLIEDGIDVALRVGSIVHETMVARHIQSFRHVLVASSALVARLGRPDTPSALGCFPCAVWGTGLDDHAPWQLGDTLVGPNTVLSCNDYLLLRRHALLGDVVTELPSFLALPAIREQRLVALLPEYPMPEHQLHLLYPSHRHPSTLVRVYLDFCQQHAPAFLDGTAPVL
ncbi:LysR family transcriptional regulator [Oceanimonas baumannii]|uniref:LysR family transcriptional regulator n=1 Tax=Oceanimonas baumannii TaxID=129578 RepID=UPI001D195A23|nr:LysR family transcriptional regulator [Oceanimonas baumannii]MCC4266136.1 LysR family transcriptional regulator [Oceanimonas baumannii]